MRSLGRFVALAAVCASVLVVGASAREGTSRSGAIATAWAVKVIVPGATGASSQVVAAPPDAVDYGGAYSYPADGSIVKAASTTASASTTPESATATAQIASLTLFGGDITATSVTGAVHAVAAAGGASGDAGSSSVEGLTVLGQPVSATPNEQIPLGVWGTATALEEPTGRAGQGASTFHGFTIALDVVLSASHGGLPAGSEIQVGYAEVTAQASVQETIPTITVAAQPTKPAATGSKPLTATPPLGGTDYVFPVYGQTAWGDTYGAPRPDVPGGWHHGDDLFAPLGTPLVAVAHGTVFSVGFNRIGGWRLWLRDDEGNEFYYAHLSAYSPLGVDGAIVNAGDVLGFVGSSGDADGGAYHLHFEIHPVGLLQLGYDGAVDPSSYLRNWRHVQVAHLVAGANWTPPPVSANAPEAGAILLAGTDISGASGLDPTSLGRIVGGRSVVGR